MHAKAVLIYENVRYFIDILREISLRSGKNQESSGLRDNNDGDSDGGIWEPAFS